MAVGTTTSTVLGDSIQTIVAKARSRREYDAVIPQLVDRQDLPSGTDTWKEVLFEQLAAMAVTEQTVNNNPQRYDDSAITSKPQMIQIMTIITDKTARNISPNSLAQMGKQVGEAMMRKKDEDGLTALDGSTTQLGAANSPLETPDITSARYNITSNTTEKGNLPIYGVFHGFQLKDFSDELTAAIGTYNITDGPTAEVFKGGFTLPVSSVNIYEDGNISIDSSDDAKGFVFAKEAWVLVSGMTIKTETDRLPGVGGGADALYMTDEFSYVERSAGNWSYELIGDATAPA
jgi:hypothetical protein